MSFADFFKSKKEISQRQSNARSDPLIGSPAESTTTTKPVHALARGPSSAGKGAPTNAAAVNKRRKTKRIDEPNTDPSKGGGGSYSHHESSNSANVNPRPRKRRRRDDDRAPGPESSSSLPGSRRNRSSKRTRTGAASIPSTAARKSPPTPESLELSERLRHASRHKLAAEAVDAFWDPRYDRARDPHHACMLVDCCARAAHPGCEATVVDAAERAVDAVTKPTTQPASVELRTALIKLYAKAGLLSRASALFKRMCESEARKPNVRTLNTLLRGCLWTAAVQQDSRKKDDGRKTGSQPIRPSWRGGVAIAEEAWSLYRETTGSKPDAFDPSSYEYSILLLCQSMKVRDAQRRAEELQTQYGIRIKGKATLTATNPIESVSDAFETLAVVHLALARSYALLGRMEDVWLSCQRALSAVAACRKRRGGMSADESNGTGDGKTPKRETKHTHGGKRAWKPQRPGDPTANEQQGLNDSRREDSNAAYREHKLRELQDEAHALLRLRRDQQGEEALSPALLWNRLSTSLFVFPSGGEVSSHTAALASDAAAWYSYGGCQVGKILGMASPGELAHKDVLRKSGTIRIGKVFGGPGRSKAPLDVELGSGYGDWIVRSAASEPDRNHVAVEVRSDRVFQIFAKASLGAGGRPLANLCVVGSDAGSFLRDRLEPGCVSALYVHHPEPPTQSLGGNPADLDAIIEASGVASEPNHMLRSDTIVAAARALKPDGRLVVVTDNRNYARLVVATVAKAARTCPALIRSPTPHEVDASGLRRSNESPRAPFAVYEKRHVLSSRQPGSGSSTWFDRLWQTAGTSSRHAEQHTRYVILIYRSNATT